MGCPICNDPKESSQFLSCPIPVYALDCRRCGNTISITRQAQGLLNDDRKRRIVSSFCQRRSRSGIQLDSRIVESLLTTQLPTIKEQIDLLVTYYGDNARGDIKYKLDPFDTQILFPLAALLMLPLEYENDKITGLIERILRIGSFNEGCGGFFKGKSNASREITFKGWERYHAMQSATFDEKKQAFFALQFPRNGEYKKLPEIQKLYDEIARRSSEELGIKIWNPLLGEPKGGLIHSRMEVEIRKSLFLVADLSHGNQGAYWEAGFAHGIGLPVFYLCHGDNEKKVHFDTGPYFRIKWDKTNIDTTISNLFDTVRATLPNKVVS